MPASEDFILGEVRRTLDDRYRVSIPAEMVDPLIGGEANCILAKERPGALSLWSAATWQTKLDSDVRLVKNKMQAGRLDGRVEEVQLLGRLLSTRQKTIQLAGRGRLLIPEGFRQFLGVDPGSELLLVGAAICIEIWQPEAWITYLDEHIPDFRRLLDNLSA